jgi:hypothetical protein
MKRTIITYIIIAVSTLLVAAPVANASAGRLTLNEAKSEARWAAWRLPVAGTATGTKVQWTIRWSKWRVEVGIEKDGAKTITDEYYNPCDWVSIYGDCVGNVETNSYQVDTWSMTTVTITKNRRTGAIRHRIHWDELSTWDG